jgi:hypothetical protein|tara:strand:- start:6493 stop:6744 length:252 start_codon:yes stop_codon:yes gene_type:complete
MSITTKIANIGLTVSGAILGLDTAVAHAFTDKTIHQRFLELPDKTELKVIAVEAAALALIVGYNVWQHRKNYSKKPYDINITY